MTQRLDELAGSQDEVLGDATAQMRELRDEVAAALAVREGAWQGSLAFSAGFRGGDATARVDATLSTPRVSSRVSLYERALDAGVEGRLNSTFGLTARFISGPLGETGLVGPVVQVSPALSVAALGGTANGLALGGYVNHDGAGADGLFARPRRPFWVASCKKTSLARSRALISWGARAIRSRWAVT